MKFCIAVCLLTISAATASAATYTVTNTNDSGPGSLRQAIVDANVSTEDDVINFDPTVFAPPQTITLTSGELTIINNGALTISGPAAGATISGNNQSRVFLIHEGANATISDLTITGGNGVGAIFQDVSIGVGGGILNYRGTLTLNNSTVSGNSTTTGGGGIFSARGTTVISNSTISNNSADGMKRLMVYNVLGQLIIDQAAHSKTSHELKVGSLASGMYTLRIETDNGTLLRKFEVQR